MTIRIVLAVLLAFAASTVAAQDTGQTVVLQSYGLYAGIDTKYQGTIYQHVDSGAIGQEFREVC